MMVSKITEAVIYETPDGSETIYVRESGSTQRHHHVESPREIRLTDQLREDKLWGDIRRTAKTNPTLQRALDEAVLIYTLSK
jgi:hypothetical protein